MKDMIKLFLSVAAIVLVAFGIGSLQANPKADAKGLDGLFDALAATESPEEAAIIERRIERAWLATGDDDLDRFMTQAVVLMNRNRFYAAIGIYDYILNQDPTIAEAWNQRAAAHFFLGNLGQASRDIAKAVALEPRHFRALIGYGLIQQQQGNDALALDHFEQALEINPFVGGIQDRVVALRSIVNGEPI